MKRVLVLQHVAHEPLGTLHALLREGGFRIRYANYSRDPSATVDVRRYDGLVVLGGPMGVYEAEQHPHLRAEIELVQAAIAERKPVLGICLGAQLIASALGAHVEKLPRAEIGWYDIERSAEGERDPMLGELDTGAPIFQWHQDGCTLPDGATLLARSADCPVQAFRYDSHVYALQFHLEVDPQMIDRWLDRPEHFAQIEGAHGVGGREQIRHETTQRIEASMQSGRRVFGRWLELFGSKRKRVMLPSRG